jgi:hypothetical protein
MKCPYCGAQVHDGDADCTSCNKCLTGTKTNEKDINEESPVDKNEIGEYQLQSDSELRRVQTQFWLAIAGSIFALAILCLLAGIFAPPILGQLFYVFAIFLAIVGIPFGILGILNILGKLI